MDVTQQMKAAGQKLAKFKGDVRGKKLEREKLHAEIQEGERKINEIRTIEREMRLKRSSLVRLDTEISRLDREAKRLTREIPNMANALREMEKEQGGRFRGLR